MAIRKFFTLEFQGGVDTIKQLAGVELKLKEIQVEIAAAKKAGKDDVYKELRVSQEDLKKTASDLRIELKNQTRDFETLKLPTGSLEAMRKEYGKLIREVSLLTKEQRESAEGLEKIKIAGQLKQDILDIDQAAGNFFSNIGNYKSAFDALLPGLSGFGDRLGSIIKSFNDMPTNVNVPDLDVPKGSAGAFDLIKNSANGALAAVRSLFATPIGWVLAIGTAIAGALKVWSDYNENILESRKLTEDITKLTGEQAVAIRSQALAISEVTETELRDNLNAANTAVKNFGISYSDALDVIGDGLIQAGNKSDLFLESVSEYSTFFGDAGFSFQEFANIINEGIDLGIYNDKLPDAIKEFQLSVTEATKASRDALENAFGRAFTDRLLLGIRDGSISTKDALEQVATEAKRVGINSQQAQQLTADLFRGAGEDAGGALKIFNAVNAALSKQPKILTEIQEGQAKSIDIQTRLNQAQAEALETEKFFSFKQTFVNLWKEVQIVWYNFISSYIDSWNSLYENVVLGIAGWKGLFLGIPIAFNVVKEEMFKTFQQIGKAVSQLGDVIGNALTLDFDEAKIAFNQLKKTVNDTGSTIAGIGGKVNEAITKSVTESKKQAFIGLQNNKKILAEQAKFEKEQAAARNKNLSQEEKDRLAKEKDANKKSGEDRLKIIEDQEKRISEIRSTISELTSKNISNDFDKQITEATNKSIQSLKKVEDQQKALNEKVKGQSGKETSTDIAEAKLIDEETAAIKAALDRQIADINEKRQKAFDDARKALEKLQAENIKALSELSLTQGENNITNIKTNETNDIRKITISYEEDLNGLSNLLAKGEINTKEFELRKKKITDQFNKEKYKIEIKASNDVLNEKERLLSVEKEIIKARKEASFVSIDENLSAGIDKAKNDFDKGLIKTQEELESQIAALRDKANTEKLIAIETAKQEEIAAIDEVAQAELDANQKLLASEKQLTDDVIAENQKRAQALQELKEAAINIAGTLSDSLFDIAFDSNEKRKNNAIESVEKEYEKKSELAQGNATLEAAVAEELQAKKQEIEKVAFEKNKKLQIAQTLINSALAATAIFAVPDFTFGIATAAKLAALAITTAASIAKIKAQEFNFGGVVKVPESEQGIINHAPNIKATNKGDNILIKAKKGEMILNENSQQKAERVWPTIWRDIKIPGFADGGLVGVSAPNFSGVTSSMKIEISEDNILKMAIIIAGETSKAVETGAKIGASEGTYLGNNDSLRLKERQEKLNKNTLV